MLAYVVTESAGQRHFEVAPIARDGAPAQARPRMQNDERGSADLARCTLGVNGGGVMSTCRLCGSEIREGDDSIVVGDDRVHPDCAGAPTKPARRRLGVWASMGMANQMAIGDVQREP